MIGTVEFEAGDIAEDRPNEKPLFDGIKRILSYYKIFENASDTLLNYLTLEYRFGIRLLSDIVIC